MPGRREDRPNLITPGFLKSFLKLAITQRFYAPRLADEYDAARKRGGNDKVTKLPDGKFGPADIGLSDKALHEARAVRSASGPRQPTGNHVTKLECANALSTSLHATSRWRLGLDERFPDHRNQKAAKQLNKLAGEVANLSDECFESLRPFVGTPQWGAAVKATARVIGFARRRMSLQYFVRQLVGLLEAPEVSGQEKVIT